MTKHPFSLYFWLSVATVAIDDINNGGAVGVEGEGIHLPTPRYLSQPLAIVKHSQCNTLSQGVSRLEGLALRVMGAGIR